MRDDATDLTDLTNLKVETILTDIGGVVLLPDAVFWERLQTELGPQASVRPQDVFYGAEGPWGRCRAGQLGYPAYMREVADLLGVDAGRLEACARSVNSD
jgi:hypothetical protein